MLGSPIALISSLLMSDHACGNRSDLQQRDGWIAEPAASQASSEAATAKAAAGKASETSECTSDHLA